MRAMKTTVIIAIIVASAACVIESRSPRTRHRISKPKVEQRPCKGKKCSISTTGSYRDRLGIIGGGEAIPHSWPWMVFIKCWHGDDGDRLSACGGSLISDRWIITAGHCFFENETEIDVPGNCKVYLGKHDLRIEEPTQLTSNIADCSVHEKFDSTDLENGYDLALIKLPKPVKFTDAIKPISLPFGLPELPFYKSCITTGWGRTEYSVGEVSDKLMQLSTMIMDDESCRNTAFPADRVICTTSGNRNKDLAKGDSGGPLACEEDDEKWYLRGVTSTLEGDHEQIAYFTKVASYEQWIKNIV